MSKRLCKIFNCDRRRGSYCCADCGYREKNCKNPCLNHPSRCGQVAGLHVDMARKPKGG